MSKIKAIVATEKQKMEDGINNRLINHQQDRTKTRINEMFGAIRAIEAIRIQVGSILNAQFMRGLQQFQEEKGHEEYGFSRFDDFLDGYEHSPLTKHQYYERIKLLESEGDELYDALNALRIPVSARKLLSDGSIHIEGDAIVIGEERISLDDKVFLKQTIKTIAQEQQKTNAKVEKFEKKLKKGEEENLKLKQQIDRLQQGNPLDGDSAHPHAVAFMNLSIAFKQLLEEAEQLTDEEKAALAPRTFETIAAQMDKLSVAYNREAAPVKGSKKKKKELPEVLSSVSDEELAELMD